jgi:hypothetical protein
MVKKYYMTVLLLLFSIALLGNVRIGIVGDQTGSSNLKKSYAIMAEGCKTLNVYKPEIVLHVGDIVESTKGDEEVKFDFNKAADNLNDISVNGSIVPWYLAAGDHDVNPPNDYTPGTKNKEKQKLFLQLLSKEYSTRKINFLNINNLYYSFDFKGYHFICLFSEDNLRTDPRWGNIFMDKLNREQFNWLQKDLQKVGNNKGIIVFLHQPMWYNWTGWQKVHDLLKRYNTIAVIAGHFHYNQNEGYKDGIRYVVVGSTGGDIKTASDNAGGVYHVTVMDIDDDNKIGLSLISLGDDNHSVAAFTARRDMDRIQTIYTMQTTLEWDPKYAGKVVEANPIDIPVNIYTKNGSACKWNFYDQIAPGVGVMLANLSSVSLHDPKVGFDVNAIKYEFVDRGCSFWIASSSANL